MKAQTLTEARRELSALDRKGPKDWKAQQELKRLRREFADARKESKRAREGR